MNLSIAITVFPLVFLGELPDKTMFASLVLASRGRPLAVWIGAAAAPAHTARGRPRDASTSEANIVLSGNSPRKIRGNTAAAMATSMAEASTGPEQPHTTVRPAM